MRRPGRLAAHRRRPLQRAALLPPLIEGRNSAWEKLVDHEAKKLAEEQAECC